MKTAGPVNENAQTEMTPLSPATGTTVLESMHKLLLEALRHNEQEIIRYLAILGPALGGFVWLLHYSSGDVKLFTVGTMGVLLLLLLGTIYSLALGYNYRYIVLELAKLEAVLQVRDAMLIGWPRCRHDFLTRYRLWRIPWCAPPEVIKVFWWAFLVGIAGVTVTVCAYGSKTIALWLVIPAGVVCLIAGLLSPILFGIKLKKCVKKEPKLWDSRVISGTALCPDDIKE